VPELVDPPPSCRFSTRCPYAVELCHTTDPRMLAVEGGHTAACFAHDSAADLGIRPEELPSFDRRTA
jgi:ABC-type antimicrobial peptide transport system ATPase subunit